MDILKLKQGAFLKTIITTTLLLFTIPAALAAPYQIDKAHTEIEFSVTHLMVSKAKGSFRDFNGTLNFEEKKGQIKDINVVVQMASIDTNEPKRDEHLRSADFFDVAKFPTMTFRAESISVKEGKPTKVKGMLTIKETTKPVTLDLTYNGRQTDPFGVTHWGFQLTGTINRIDFGVKWNAPLAKTALDKGGIALGEEVSIDIAGEFIPHVETK